MQQRCVVCWLTLWWCDASAGSLSLNETDITTLCVPYPVGGWGYGAYNDTSPDVIPLRAAAIAYPSGAESLSSSFTPPSHLVVVSRPVQYGCHQP